MGKKATKAANNIFYIARYEAAKFNEAFTSRENAAEILGIDRTRLARIELGSLQPYPEEILLMSKLYRAPELCHTYCSKECEIGKSTMNEIHIKEFDRLILQVLGSIENASSLKTNLIDIAQDGIIDESEQPAFYSILDSLDRIATNAQALKLWALKNIKTNSPLSKP